MRLLVLSFVLLLPALSGAQVPRLDLTPKAPRAFTPAEVRAAIARAPRAEPPKRFADPAQVIDDVAVIRSQVCDDCPISYLGENQGFDYYDYTHVGSLLVREILRDFGDKFETPIVFTGFLSRDTGGAFYLPIYTPIEGIGSDPHDLREAFGSSAAGPLRGFVSMNVWWNCKIAGHFSDGCRDAAPFATSFRSFHGVLAQEVGHEWGANLEFIGADARRSQELLGRDASHWSYWLDTGGSPLEGVDWQDNGGGNFTRAETRFTKYSDLDLYAMGLKHKDEVEPTFFIQNPSPHNRVCDTSPYCGAATPPERGPSSVTGERVDVHISDIIAALGRRSPSVEESPKTTHNLFTLVLLADDTRTDVQVAAAKIGRLRRYWNEYFYEATGQRMRTITTVSNRDDYARWEFTHGTEGWTGTNADAQPLGGTVALTAAEGGGVLALALAHERVQLHADEYRSAVVRLGVAGGERPITARLKFAGTSTPFSPENVYELEPIADGTLRSYVFSLEENTAWTGVIGKLAVEFEGLEGQKSAAIDRIFFSTRAAEDLDGDHLIDAEDNCPEVANLSQADRDGDGKGDACSDADDDGHADAQDNCPELANPDQADANGDGIGDACDEPDADVDGIPDAQDNCPNTVNAEQLDGDGDGVGDVCDAAPTVPGASPKPSARKKDEGGGGGSGCSAAGGTPGIGALLGFAALLRRRRRRARPCA